MNEIKDFKGMWIGGKAKVSDIRKHGLLKASGLTEEDFNRR